MIRLHRIAFPVLVICIWGLSSCKKKSPEKKVTLSTFLYWGLESNPRKVRDSVILSYENDKLIQIKKIQKFDENSIQGTWVYTLKYEGESLVAVKGDIGAAGQSSADITIANHPDGNIKTLKSGSLELRFRYNLNHRLSGMTNLFNDIFEEYVYDSKNNLSAINYLSLYKKYEYGEVENPFKNINLPGKIFLSFVSTLQTSGPFNTISPKSPVSYSRVQEKVDYTIIPFLNKTGNMERVKIQVKSNGILKDHTLIKFYYK